MKKLLVLLSGLALLPTLERGALRPASWRLDVTERFLFKKFVIEGRVECLDFELK
ncbi:MAG: hypothetical protein ACE5GX_10175 [Thermoanaerobaculia bacterium]